MSKIKFEALIHLVGVNPEIYSGFKANEVYKKNIEIHKKTIDLIFRKNSKSNFFLHFQFIKKQNSLTKIQLFQKKILYDQKYLWNRSC